MKEHLKRIDNDMFGIERRLMVMDPGYRLFYNTKLARFEVHNIENPTNSLAVISPFSVLDRRLIDYVRRTRVERSGEIFKEIEKHNTNIDNNKKRKVASDVRDILADLKNYLKGENL